MYLPPLLLLLLLRLLRPLSPSDRDIDAARPGQSIGCGAEFSSFEPTTFRGKFHMYAYAVYQACEGRGGNCIISNIIPTLLRPEASFRLRRCVQFAGNLEGSPTTAYLTARTSSNTSARGVLQMAQRTRNLGSSSPTRRESVGMADGKKFQPR